jgi:hypothetical protein
LPRQIYGPNAFLAFLVCQHTKNFARNTLLEALVRHDTQNYSHGASFDFECLHVEAKPEEDTNPLLPHLSGWVEQAKQIPDEDMNPLLPHSSG